MWVDGRRGGRQLASRETVVVDDDDIDATLASHADRLDRADAAIDGDDELRAFVDELAESVGVETVAVSKTIRQEDTGRDANGAEEAEEHARRRHAVDVVVSVNDDGIVSV